MPTTTAVLKRGVKSMASPTQTSIQARMRLDARIASAALQLDPQAELEGTILAQYTPWQFPDEIPAELAARVCADLEAEQTARAALGDEKYFANRTGAEIAALYRRALDLIPGELEKETQSAAGHVTFAVFRRALNRCMALAAPTPPPEPPSKAAQKKPTAKRGKKKQPKPPKSVDEVAEYIKAGGYNVDAQAFFNYYAAADWYDSAGKPVLSWKQRVLTWHNRGGSPPPAMPGTIGRGANVQPIGGQPAGEGENLLAGRMRGKAKQ